MKFIHLLFAAVFTLAFAACKNENTGKTQTPDNSTQAAPATPANTATDASTTVTLTPLNTSGDVGRNPPHGEPGHRCDMPVGAPLDGSLTPPGKTNPLLQTEPASDQSPVIITTQPATQTTKPGMNPPHGQPNHRCDIAVGAPLNSVPKQ
jgi:hypothetical protein